METFGVFLRGLRQARRLTLGQLSLRAGLNKGTLSRWETGTNFPRLPELGRVLDALDASPSVRAKSLRLLDAPRALFAERSSASSNAPMRLSLGDLLFGLRQRVGKTQTEVARATNLSRSLYSQWENDTNQPTTDHLHAVGYTLGASAEEIAALSCGSLASTSEKSRDALLHHYMAVLSWHTDMTPAMYHLHLLSLLANLGRLYRAGKADIGDMALIIKEFGCCAEMWHNNTHLKNEYHHRALVLAAQSKKLLHFHLVSAVRSQLILRPHSGPVKARVAAALDWLPRFQDKAGQAYLLSFIAGAIAKEDPDEALRLAEKYCALVADNPDEYPCRLRDRGNLLYKCGRFAESVAFIAALEPPDFFREGIKQLELGKGLAALGSLAEARQCLTNGKRILAPMRYAFLQTVIYDLERTIS